MECFLDDLRAFSINAEEWTTEAQDEEEWRRTADQGAERFMAEWIAAEKTRAGLRHAVVYPDVTGRTKERIAQSKQARGVTFVLFCLVLVFFLSLNRRSFVQFFFVLRYSYASPTTTRSYPTL